MVRALSLTPTIMARREPLMKLRDCPNGEECTCCFCEQRFIEGHSKWRRTWEHLDNDDANQELWNLAWAHFYCNNIKKGNPEFQSIAFDIIQRNKKWQSTFDFESAREREKLSDPEEHTEIELNTAHMQETREFLAEKITDKPDSKYPFSDAIYCIVSRCREETGHGSPQAVRNYLKELTCSEGKYNVKKIKGVNYIVRRTGE